MKKIRLCTVMAMLMALLLLVGCGNSSENEGNENLDKLDFTATTIDGETIESAKLFSKSKITMINVWATYCGPCKDEMPDLGKIQKEWRKKNLQIIGIIGDVPEGSVEEGLEEAKKIIESTKAKYPHLLLNKELYTEVVGTMSAVPTTIFVNDKGEILASVVGARTKKGWEIIIDQVWDAVQ